LRLIYRWKKKGIFASGTGCVHRPTSERMENVHSNPVVTGDIAASVDRSCVADSAAVAHGAGLRGTDREGVERSEENYYCRHGSLPGAGDVVDAEKQYGVQGERAGSLSVWKLSIRLTRTSPTKAAIGAAVACAARRSPFASILTEASSWTHARE
jgi:hypothetical protein